MVGQLGSIGLQGNFQKCPTALPTVERALRVLHGRYWSTADIGEIADVDSDPQQTSRVADLLVGEAMSWFDSGRKAVIYPM